MASISTVCVHTFTSNLLAKGVAPKDVQELLGHSDVNLTMNVCAHATNDTFSNPWDIFELHRKEDIDKLRAGFHVIQLHFVASDGYTNHMRETVDQMYELYLKYHLAVYERQDMVGYSHHTLDIFRKD